MSIIIGLTGQTGAGKTTACEVFSAHGFAIIDCDLVARQIAEKGSPCLKSLVLEFSKSILNEDNSLNRKALGNTVFNDKKSLSKLNEITHPFILKKVKMLMLKLSDSFDIIVLDAPTLFESGADKLCDKIVSIVASKEVIIPRIMTRDSLTEISANNRLSSQHSADFFIQNSDFIASNNGDKTEFLEKLNQIASSIKGYSVKMNTNKPHK